jgi:creatinine amidohydrolase/Fe(II)-dependent formamide hydrolase-like protein
VLESGARSLCRAGFRHVFLLGDHGGYAASLQRVADRLRAATGAAPRCRVQALDEYYRAAQEPFGQALAARGLSKAEIGSHAGVADTSLMLALDPTLVRLDVAAARSTHGDDGVAGDPRRSSAELGRLGVERIVDASVAAVRERILQPR